MPIHKFATPCLVFALTNSTLAYAVDAPPKQPLVLSTANGASNVDSPSECPGDVSQHVLVQCMRDESARYDREVIEEFNTSIASLPNADLSAEGREKVKKQLVAVQQAWETFRKLDCDSRVAFLDNSDSAKLEYWDCMRRLAKQRMLDFHIFLNN